MDHRSLRRRLGRLAATVATAALTLALAAALSPAIARDRAAAADSAVARTVPCPPPLWLDAADLGSGATAVFTHMPDAAGLAALGEYETLHHVLIALPAWPGDWSGVAPLAQLPLPQGADVVVLLDGYPPSHAAAAAWNSLRMPLRIVMLVDGPPADRSMLDELNRMRGLERIVVTQPRPSRAGFERLQRPLAFRVLMP